MQIGLMTDSVAALSATETLDLAAELALDTIEFATGNWSTAPHLDLDRLLADEVARTEFAAAVTARGLRISALNANGNPLHPTTGAEQDRVVRGTIRLASLLDVSTVVCMSIEHEDLAFPPVEGVRRSVDLLRAALKAQPAWSAGRLSRSACAGQRHSLFSS